ncbi:hypothetical protein V6N13_047629 [Hibiscus sabdariffa]
MFTAVHGVKFMAKDIGFQNTAGAIKGQAVALRVQGDQAIFHNCQMDAYQDTLYAHTQRQYYRDCTVSGTVDFIFGNGAAVFQNCKIIVRKPLDNQKCIVTAQGRKRAKDASGFVLQNCIISGAPEYLPVKARSKTYLGRPWHEYSRTLIMQSQLDDIIAPEGWMPWNGNFALDTLWYAEFNNRDRGPSRQIGLNGEVSKRSLPLKPNNSPPVLDMAIQAHGGARVSSGTVLARLSAASRTLRFADGSL